MKLYMEPDLSTMAGEESGIKRVIENYHKHLPKFGIEFTGDYSSADVTAVHIDGTSHDKWNVFMCHGLYWSADHICNKWEWAANAKVIGTAIRSKLITVPSAWVAETFQRDMRITPEIVGHGIDWEDWQGDAECGDYVLWNKNRSGDVCDPAPVRELARRFPKQKFVSTFYPDAKALAQSNVKIIGVVPHIDMRRWVTEAAVYLSTTKETFGIGVLEAMAAGIPVLGFRYGGNCDLIKHGVNGFLARPGDYDELAEGLDWCLRYREQAGANGREIAKGYTWDRVCEQLVGVYQRSTVEEPPTCAVIIPCFNYGSPEKLGRAIKSAMTQTYDQLVDIAIVDDGSTDAEQVRQTVAALSESDNRIRLIRQDNRGVAVARNNGIDSASAKYICCLDADDAIEPEFLERCIDPLEQDQKLGIAYTKLRWIKPDGSTGVSDWPTEFSYEPQLTRHNMIPTCCVFRREMWRRLGGYRQRYAPDGCGAEDGEFWLRAGAYGYGAIMACDQPLFDYSWMSGAVSGNKDYKEVDFTVWHPWTKDGQHPIASIAKPKRMSHAVRQYDEPAVSVIIPVGPGHENDVINALDSLEAQTFRKWEAVVIWDGCEPTRRLLDAYPYLRRTSTGKPGKPAGAGAARNAGVQLARADLLLYLDADDTLYPECISKLVDTYLRQQSAVYPDYVMLAYVDSVDKLADDLRAHIYEHNDKTGRTVMGARSADYDCARAQSQPQRDTPYHWNLITTLFPKKWHYDIGGFDETLESWEDIDYWWRMARAGKCFFHLPEELVVYRTYTGNRREHAKTKENYDRLMSYLEEKYKGVKIMPCPGGCGGARRSSGPPVSIGPAQLTSGANVPLLSDSDFVRCVYNSAMSGQHHVYGNAAFPGQLQGISMTRRGGMFYLYYGYHAGGDIFLVHRNDVQLEPDLFVPKIDAVAREDAPAPVETPAPPVIAPEPVATVEPVPQKQGLLIDEKIPFLSGDARAELADNDITTLEDLEGIGIAGLRSLHGVGPKRAEQIMKYVSEKLHGAGYELGA